MNGPITFTDQFIEMNLVYSSGLYHDKIEHFNFLGFGERRGDLILGSNHWKHGVWNRDLPPTLGTNLYGDQPIWIAQHPFYNQAIGTIWWNSNAKSFELLPLTDGKTRLTLRSNGGIIDLFFVIDETPDLIVNTINDIVGPPTRDERTVKFLCSSSVLVLGFFSLVFCSVLCSWPKIIFVFCSVLSSAEQNRTPLF